MTHNCFALEFFLFKNIFAHHWLAFIKFKKNYDMPPFISSEIDLINCIIYCMMFIFQQYFELCGWLPLSLLFQDVLAYSATQTQFGQSIDNFYTGPFTGLISLRQVLTNTGVNTYQVNATSSLRVDKCWMGNSKCCFYTVTSLLELGITRLLACWTANAW